MDRRQFLGAAAVTAAGVAAVGWLGRCLLGGPSATDAYRQALRLGKPLLVLVIPEEDRARQDRGEILGALLNHGRTGVYLDLALCEVACATVADTRKLPDVDVDVDVDGEPLMLLVESGFPSSRATPIDPEIIEELPHDASDAGRERVDDMARERLDRVVVALREGILPTPGSLAARARSAEAHLPGSETDALRASLEAGRIPDGTALDRGAAIVRLLAESHRPHRLGVLQALADAAAARVKSRPPDGAKWARARG